MRFTKKINIATFLLTLHHKIHMHVSAEIQRSRQAQRIWLSCGYQSNERTRLEPVAAVLLYVKVCCSVALRPATTPEKFFGKGSEAERRLKPYTAILLSTCKTATSQNVFAE